LNQICARARRKHWNKEDAQFGVGKANRLWSARDSGLHEGLVRASQC
jgi:hypothetical protein